MSEHEYTATVEWHGDAAPGDFIAGRYSRRHGLRFDGGLDIAASAALSNVPLPWSDPSALDPEEAFVAAIASCHLLWFLALAARSRFVVGSYRDDAVGVMTPNGAGKLWVSRVTLRPATRFAGERVPSHEQLLALHHRAHDECFIANSVKTEIVCEPTLSFS
jgi:organic hydroperoxide reductase OsmC/OhrA